MVTISAVCLFCEDIRTEMSGQDTIVGTLPDNLQVEGPPPPTPNVMAMLPKLGVYLRIHLPASDKPKEVSAKVLNAQGAKIGEIKWASDVVDKAFDDAKTHQMPLVGLLMKLVAGPVPVSPGKITAIATIDGVDYLAGALNIILPSAFAPHV